MKTTRNKPVTGTCRWFTPPSCPKQVEHLCITPAGGVEEMYEIEYRNGLNEIHLHHVGKATRGEFVHYTLTLIPNGPGMAYRCDCPDVTKGGRSPECCKHARSVRAALKAKF